MILKKMIHASISNVQDSRADAYQSSKYSLLSKMLVLLEYVLVILFMLNCHSRELKREVSVFTSDIYHKMYFIMHLFLFSAT
jgi:hypothetical protein